MHGALSCPRRSAMVYVTNGSPVTYCFLVGNYGNTNLTSVVMEDSDLGVGPLVIGDLAAGETFQTSIAVFASGSLTNTASVSGFDPNNDLISDQGVAQVRVITPAVSIEKTVSLNGFYPGGDFRQAGSGSLLSFWMVVHNAGDVTLTNIVLTDAALGLRPTCMTWRPGRLLLFLCKRF